MRGFNLSSGTAVKVDLDFGLGGDADAAELLFVRRETRDGRHGDSSVELLLFFFFPDLAEAAEAAAGGGFFGVRALAKFLDADSAKAAAVAAAVSVLAETNLRLFKRISRGLDLFLFPFFHVFFVALPLGRGGGRGR